MTPQKVHIESLEDMVFKNRNQEYGAYVLRKKYSRYVTVSFIIALFVLAGAAAYPIVTAYMSKNKQIVEDKTVGAEMLDIPKEEAAPPPPPPPPEILEQKVKFTAPKVVEDTNVDQGVFIQDELSTKVSTEAPSEEIVVEEEEKTQIIEQKVEEIFTVVEEQPSYPGGEEARLKYLQDNIKYPVEAKELGIQGRVFVSFVVEPDGSVSNVSVLRGIGGGCDEEAIRVVKNMPKWVPGKQRGVPVRVRINLPIKFTLQ
ncbi:MAG: TonB family protein [Bacteroidetes bacterium]|nr:TonB family protein [Bacteroidota bacterium]